MRIVITMKRSGARLREITTFGFTKFLIGGYPVGVRRQSAVREVQQHPILATSHKPTERRTRRDRNRDREIEREKREKEKGRETQLVVLNRSLVT